LLLSKENRNFYPEEIFRRRRLELVKLKKKNETNENKRATGASLGAACFLFPDLGNYVNLLAENKAIRAERFAP
jgi:hypothetical protein